MKPIQYICLLCMVAFFSGCATAPILSKDVSQDLRGSKVAVAYAQLNKKIHYQELVYKVLWNETRTHDVSFDGLWDIDSELSAYMASRVTQIGLNAVSVYDVASKDSMMELHQTLLSKQYSDPLKLSDALRDNLLQNNIDYLIVVDSDYISVYAQIGVKQGSALADIYLQNVRSNEQKYFSGMGVGGKLKVEKKAREIEDNNLQGLKESLKEWLALSISKGMPKQLGLVE